MTVSTYTQGEDFSGSAEVVAGLDNIDLAALETLHRRIYGEVGG